MSYISIEFQNKTKEEKSKYHHKKSLLKSRRLFIIYSLDNPIPDALYYVDY